MIAARAMKSGAGGIQARPTADSAAAAMPSATVTRSAPVHVRPPARRTTGVIPSEATNALAMSAPNGGSPTSGNATFSAAKIDTTKKT